MCWTFFIFVWCSCIQRVLMQTASWDLVTSPVVFGKPIELRCTVKLVDGIVCCSQLTRIWSKDSTQILTNGVPSLPSKYHETIDATNNQFSLVINDLSKEDVDVDYTCAYGNISPQKTLTQNNSFEYHPTESECPVKLDNGELVGTLSVAMSAPYPSVFAQYGDRNFTPYLATKITPVAGSTKFYTINSFLKGEATCGNNKMFTLSVLTGVTTTNICDNVDFCECRSCIRTCLGWSSLGTIVTTITIWVFIILYRLSIHPFPLSPPDDKNSTQQHPPTPLPPQQYPMPEFPPPPLPPQQYPMPELPPPPLPPQQYPMPEYPPPPLPPQQYPMPEYPPPPLPPQQYPMPEYPPPPLPPQQYPMPEYPPPPLPPQQYPMPEFPLPPIPPQEYPMPEFPLSPLPPQQHPLASPPENPPPLPDPPTPNLLNIPAEVIKCFIVSVMMDAIFGSLIGYKVCRCIDGTDRLLILLGVCGTGTALGVVVLCKKIVSLYAVIVSVYAVIGRKTIKYIDYEMVLPDRPN